MMFKEIKTEQKAQLEQEMSYIDNEENQTREEDIKGDIQ